MFIKNNPYCRIIILIFEIKKVHMLSIIDELPRC